MSNKSNTLSRGPNLLLLISFILMALLGLTGSVLGFFVSQNIAAGILLALVCLVAVVGVVYVVVRR